MFVPTRSSRLKKKDEESCQQIVFASKKKEKIVRPDDDIKPKIKDDVKKKESNLDLKKLRYDIIKFGSSGFDGTKKEESRRSLAVALGAKPPKKKGKNYTQILAEKKAEKEKVHKLQQNLIKPIFKKKNSRRKPRDKNESKGLLNKYGKVPLKKDFP